MKKLVSAVCFLVLALGLLAACGNNGNDASSVNEAADTTLRFPADGSLVRVNIGATPAPHQQILEYIREDLRAAGIDLQITPFTDFHVPNVALTDGHIHANFFQHVPFLNLYITNTGNPLHVVGEIHVEPMGAYSMTLDDIMDIPDGGTVAIPGDATNGGRALMLLEQAGLIGLDPDAGINPAAGVLATVADVTYNPRNLQFVELEASLLPRVLLDDRGVDVSVVNTNHLLAGTDLCPVEDSLVRENIVGNPYANVLVVRPEDADSEVIATLFRYMTSEYVRAFIMRTYTGVEPVF